MIRTEMCVLFFSCFPCDHTVVDCFCMQPLGVGRDAGLPFERVCR